MSPDAEDGSQSDDPSGEDAARDETRAASDAGKRPRTPGAQWNRISEMIQPASLHLAQQLKLANQARFNAIAQPIVDAQRAQMNAMVEPILIAERARTESLMAPVLAAQQAQRDAVMRPLQAQLAQIARPVFAPLLRAIPTQPDFTPFVGQLTAARAAAFDNRRLLDVLPDIDDLTVDELLESEELQAAVEEFVQSGPVSELLEEIDIGAITDDDAEQARAAASEFAANPDAWGGLTTRQIVVRLTAVHILVIAAVLSLYGYDVGKVADVVALPLAILAVADTPPRRSK